ncbi:hypothetical protein EKD04_007130 [Chloroflexales bacterium ZM16-3]|nr:hypothetical protein [Chloroflexales bacterium ZM16-3]
MATLYPLQSILFGLMGWAATALAVMSSSQLTNNDQRAMVVCSWMVWMIPAFGALVYRGLMTTNNAAIYCAVTTVLLALIVIVGSVARPPRTHP